MRKSKISGEVGYGLLLWVAGAVGTVVVYAHTTFQTKGDADKRGDYSDRQLSLMRDDMKEMKSDIKELLRANKR